MTSQGLAFYHELDYEEWPRSYMDQIRSSE